MDTFTCEAIADACRNIASMWFCSSCGIDFADGGKEMMCDCEGAGIAIAIENWWTFTGKLDEMMFYPKNILLQNPRNGSMICLYGSDLRRDAVLDLVAA